MEKTIKVLKGFILSVCVFLVSSLIFGLLLKFTDLPEKWGMYYILASLCLGSLFFGFYMGHILKRRGVLYGMIYAAMLVIPIVYVITVCLSLEFSIGINDMRYFACLIFGGIGGMLGVNMKN